MTETQLIALHEPPMPYIDEKGFYQTPNVMSIKAIRAKLTGADWALWEYFKMFDPHGDRMVDLPSVQEISHAVGISIRQFKRSLKKLEELGLYDSEPVKIRGQNLAGKLAKQICQEKKQSKFSGKDKMTDLPIVGQDCRIDDESAESMTDLPIVGQDCPNQPLEPLPQADSKIPQTIQTSSDLNQTLSDSDERENESFEKFCRRKIDELPQRPNNPKAYIRKYREDYLAEWQEEEAKRKLIEAQIEASKPQTAEQPKTAEQLNKSWQSANRIKAATALKAIEAEARELGYEVTEEGIFDAKLNSSSEVNFPPSGTGFEPKRE